MSKRITLLILMSVFLLVSLQVVIAASIDDNVFEDLDKNSKVDVIIMLKEDTSGTRSGSSGSEASTSIAVKQENVLSDLMEEDFELKYKFSNVEAISGKVSAQGLAKLANDPNVLRIYKPGIAVAHRAEANSLINADDVWLRNLQGLNITGAGETICVIDSGIDYTHTEFGSCTEEEFLAGNCSKVISGYDFCGSDGGGCTTPDANPFDDDGHGTHVAGIAAGNGISGNNKGIAFDAKIVAIKALNASGRGDFSNIASGIDWCVNNASKFNISVIVMSLGDSGEHNLSSCPASTYSATTSAINNATAAGIFVVASSGNSGFDDGISYPACLANVTSVGAVDDGSEGTTEDNIPNFVNSDEILDLLAPGCKVVSTVPTGSCTNCHSSGYLSGSGTSMAAPFVGGAAALIFQHERLEGVTIDPGEIRTVLKNKGVNVTDSKNSLVFPRIDILAAIKFLDDTPTSAAAGLAELSKDETWIYWNWTNPSETDFDHTEVWLNSVFKVNLTSNISYYNATGLSADTEYNLTLKSADDAGNLNQTSDNATTLGLFAPEIMIVSPTPSHKSKLNTTWIFVNITSDRDLREAWLEWDGTTNISMSNSSLKNWYINKTDVSGDFTYRIIGNRTEGKLGVSSTRDITLNSTDPNNAPFFNPALQDQTAIEDQEFTYDIDVTDLDGDNITFLDNVSEFNISSNGVITWTPTNDDVGSLGVRINITDGNVNISEVFVITIENTNDAPVIDSWYWDNSTINSTTNQTIYLTENNTIFFNASASDVDNVTLLYNWYFEGELNSTEQNLTYDVGLHNGGTRNVTLIVSDGSLNDSVSWTLIVVDPWLPSFSHAFDNLTVNEDSAIVYDINASDDDADTLTYSANISGIINSSTGLLNWTPTNDYVGNNTINITVSDGYNSVSKNLNIDVNNTNDPPIISSISSQTATVNEEFSLDVSATDPDPTGDTLTFSDNTNLFNINSGNGNIEFTPDSSDEGSYSITITVQDNHGATDSETFTLTIEEESSNSGGGTTTTTTAEDDVVVTPSTTTTDSSVTEEIDDEITSVEYLGDDIDKYLTKVSSIDKNLVADLNIEGDLKFTKTNIASIESALKALKGSSISDTKKELEFTKLQNRLTEIKKSTIVEAEIISTDEFTQSVKDSDIDASIESIVVKDGLDDSEKQNYVSEAARLKDKVSVDVNTKVLDVKYLSGNTGKITMFKKTISLDSSEELYIVETIPKDIASTAGEITFRTADYEIVKDDPVVRWSFSDLVDKEIIYTVNKEVSDDLINSTKLVVLPKLDKKLILGGEETEETLDGFISLFDLNLLSFVSIVIVILVAVLFIGITRKKKITKKNKK